MTKQSTSTRQQSTSSRPKRDAFAVAAAAFAISLLSLSYYFQKSEILLYGDAVAHINIARRVFDSQTPGLLQLGTVWLPLPHLLMIPFLLSDAMWQTGIGGSIPSMIAYVFGAVGIFRIALGLLTRAGAIPVQKLGAWLAALVFAANPNLIYLQTTAMTETIYLGFFIWALVYFVEFVTAEQEPTTKDTKRHEGKYRPLSKCALCIAGAELTRYDGWMLAISVGLAVAVLAIRNRQNPVLRRTTLKFFFIIAAPPLLWLAYNAAVYGNALEFANGPYSAKAIERRTATSSMPAHPGTGNVISAEQYFLKSAELNMASGNWGRIWIAIAISSLIAALTQSRRNWAVLLLCVPLLFYALSIAYGGVPIFFPPWWPFTFYNVRYGIQLLPLFAISAGLTPLLVKQQSKTTQIAVLCAVGLFATLSYLSIWRTQPVCLIEAQVNSRSKRSLELAVSRTISGLPRNSSYLMYLGDHVGAFQQAGTPLRQVINEGNHRPWKRRSDPDGLWERALADPMHYADFVIAFDGDAVDRGMNKQGLTLLSVIHTTGQPEARVYAARAKLNQSP